MPLVVGLFALGGATVLLNLGPNVGVLILGRVLQGISAAVVWTVGLALLADTVDQSEIVSAHQRRINILLVLHLMDMHM